jgi:hypothetical protein
VELGRDEPASRCVASFRTLQEVPPDWLKTKQRCSRDSDFSDEGARIERITLPQVRASLWFDSFRQYGTELAPMSYLHRPLGLALTLATSGASMALAACSGDAPPQGAESSGNDPSLPGASDVLAPGGLSTTPGTG